MDCLPFRRKIWVKCRWQECEAGEEECEAGEATEAGDAGQECEAGEGECEAGEATQEYEAGEEECEAGEACKVTRCARRSESRADNSMFEPVTTIIRNSLPTSAGQRYATTERFLYESTTSYHREWDSTDVGVRRTTVSPRTCVSCLF